MAEDPNPVVARFRVHPVESKAQSAAQGRPVYRDVVVVEVLYPGDRLAAPVFPADAIADVLPDGTNITYMQKFHDEYEAFLRETQYVSGTPLTNLALSPARIAELNGINIYSVEALASVQDSARRRLGPDSNALVDAATEYLTRATGGLENAALAERLAEAQAEIAALRAEQTVENEDEFAAMTDADLKEAIREKTGTGVRGNPSRQTLVRAMKEVA